MTVPVLAGKNIVLRPLRPSDREARRALGVAPEVVAGFGVQLPAWREMSEGEARDWYERVGQAETTWVIDQDGRLIGTVALHSHVPADRRSSIAIQIFDETSLSRGYGTDAIRTLTRYAFGELGLHRLSIRVLASNVRAIRCYEKCGFVREGYERESASVAGGWEDDVIMGLVDGDHTSLVAESP